MSPSCPPQVAGLHYDVFNTTTGMRLAMAGYSHKLPLLLQKLLSKMAKPALEPERFVVQKACGPPCLHNRYIASRVMSLMLPRVISRRMCSSASTRTSSKRRRTSTRCMRSRTSSSSHGGTSSSTSSSVSDLRRDVLMVSAETDVAEAPFHCAAPAAQRPPTPATATGSTTARCENLPTAHYFATHGCRRSHTATSALTQAARCFRMHAHRWARGLFRRRSGRHRAALSCPPASRCGCDSTPRATQSCSAGAREPRSPSLNTLLLCMRPAHFARRRHANADESNSAVEVYLQARAPYTSAHARRCVTGRVLAAGGARREARYALRGIPRAGAAPRGHAYLALSLRRRPRRADPS